MLICLAGLALCAAPAGAVAPSPEQQYAPLNDRIQAIGEDAGASLSAMTAWTYAKRATEFGALARRTVSVSQAVGAISGSSGVFLVTRRKLARALLQGATDLSAIAAADRLRSASKEHSATQALVRDSPPINALRGALASALASAARPPLKQQFASLSLQIEHIGDDIGTAVQKADGATDALIAKQFGGLARRTAVASSSVGKLQGASGAALTAQRKLQLALAQAAVDLNAIYSAALAHSASRARKATIALSKDSSAVTSSRAALAKALV